MSTIAAAIEEEAPNQSPETIQDNYHKMSRTELLSKFISQELDLMTSEDVSPEAAKDRIDQLCVQINEARTKFNKLQTRNGPSSFSSTSIAAWNGYLELERDLQLLNKEVRVLKSMFPFCLFKKPITTDPHINWRDRSTPHFVSAAPDKLMQNLMNNENFNRTPTPQELKESLEGISYFMTRILACFLVFPHNTILKKSLLISWAEVQEGGVHATQLIQDLITKGLIHPVYKDTLTVGGYWMHPFVRSTLSDCTRFYNWRRDNVYRTDNSSEDIFYDDPTPFLTKRKLGILHLGNWQRSSLRHIEVEDPNSFFKDMAKLCELRYVSLRSVSLVTEMPQFITKLRLLETLDLKACHNLEVLPSSIANLASSLTHLDMSECYFLEDMPMALSSLRRLRVLKGFVVPEDSKENSCTLQDLLSLQNLRKLNVYSHVRSFPNRNELEALAEFRSLHSLTISWGGCSLPKKETGNSGAIATTYAIEHQLRKKYYGPFSFYKLDKLDLQCVPETVTHDWLNPTNFQNLKKLYIRGGRFCDLGQEEGEYPWNVEILRLKHLENLDMDYRVLERLFPKLMCLENVNCPNLKNFPCSDGVWKDNTKLPPTTYELQTRNGPSSSSSTSIAAGNGDLELERDLQLLNKEVRLKSMFPFCLFKIPNTTDPHINWRDRSTPHFVSSAPDKLMQNLMNNENFNRTPTPQELEASLEGIDWYVRKILACFSALPHNAIMKKSLLVRWAEVHTDGDRAPHQIHELITKGLIHPVYKNTLTVGGYWMHPFVRSSLSDHNWWRSDEDVYVTDDSSEDIFYDDPTPVLAKRGLHILHLGKWQRSSVRHIEVEDPNSFFKDMAKLSYLRYVSLRGVSLVTELPQFITKLKVLQTLDLKSCHNLEVIPSSIGNLASSLTHLDMSECYFLEDMPMALSELHCLRVLKGSVVPAHITENSCTLQDLISLAEPEEAKCIFMCEKFP